MNKSVGIIISVSVAVLLGVILISIIADNTVQRTQKTYTSETVTLNRLTANHINEGYNHSLAWIDGWRAGTTGCGAADIVKSTNVVIKNASGATLDMNGCGAGGDYVIVDGYNEINFCDTVTTNSTTSNRTTAYYTYCPDGYIAQSWGRTILNMVPGFFALALLVGGAFVIYWILKQEGVDLKI